jgi:hypothetical protein
MILANQVPSPKYYKSNIEKYTIQLTLGSAEILKSISLDTTNGAGTDLGTINGPCSIDQGELFLCKITNPNTLLTFSTSETFTARSTYDVTFYVTHGAAIGANNLIVRGFLDTDAKQLRY